MTFSLAGIVRRPAADAGAVAIVFEGRTVTYGALDERSSRAAQALRALGVEAGDRVGFLGRNTPEYFDVLFGAGKLGATTVAVNWRLHPDEMTFVLDDAQAVVVVAEPGLEPADGGFGNGRPIIELGPGFEAWLQGHEAVDPGLGAEPEDVVLQLYTSGTTGVPKGAMITNRNLGTTLDGLTPHWHFDGDSVSVVAMPLFHIGGAGYGLLGLRNGGTGLLYRDFDPAAIVVACETQGVTNVLAVPAMLQAMCVAAGNRRVASGTLRSIVYGGAPIDPMTLQRALRTFHCPFIGSYGITETCGPITQLDADEHDPTGRPELLASVGRAFEWVGLEVVGYDDDAPVPAGTVGEVRILSAQVMRGYWNRPEATAEVLDGAGWFRTGDAGFLDADGHLFLTDRVKDMIITGGENVYPVEVEHALAAHPAVADVAVFGIPHERWGETVMAVVAPTPGTTPDPDELIAFTRDRIAHYKCPTRVEVTDAIPRNPSGKILRRELRAPFWAGTGRTL